MPEKFEKPEIIPEPEFEKLEILKEDLPEDREVEEFAPKLELEKIQKLPREEKRAKLEEFKERLTLQKEGLAILQETLISEIEKNPDTPIEKFYRTVEKFKKAYDLNLGQRSIAKSILQKYEQKHEKVKKIRKEYPDDAALYKVLFDKKPKGKVEVVEGPMTLYFRCYDSEDYAQIHSQAFVNNRTLTAQDIEAANMSGGSSIGSSLVEGLEGTIIAENVPKVVPEESKTTQMHEEQHALKRFFGRELNKSKLEASLDLFQKTVIGPAGKKEMERIAERYFRGIRESMAEERAKDEILAYLKTGENPNEVIKKLTAKEDQGGIYDYLRDWRKDPLSGFLMDRENKEIVQEAAKNVFETEYRALIRRGVNSFDVLTELGYSKEQATAILISEPLIKWPKVVRRIYETKKVAAKK